MVDEHERAVTEAQQTTNRLGGLFDRMGNSDAPNGVMMRNYRAARLAMAGNVGEAMAVGDVLATLRQSVVSGVSGLIGDAYRVGNSQADEEIVIYGLEDFDDGESDGSEFEDQALDVISGLLDAQASQIQLAILVAGDNSEEVILGDDTHTGVLTPGNILSTTAQLIVAAMMAAWAARIEAALVRAGLRDQFVRQAVAAIDQRTTDCCLKVHGQTVPMRGQFRLIGTPRYADRLPAPPFHWWCRTGVALVRNRDANDGLTQRMFEAAQAEMNVRASQGRVVIHPAHATSRRS